MMFCGELPNDRLGGEGWQTRISFLPADRGLYNNNNSSCCHYSDDFGSEADVQT